MWKLVVGSQLSKPFGREVENPCTTGAAAFVAADPWGPNDTGVDCTCGSGCLFDVSEDESELFDVKSKYPQVFRDMQDRLQEARKTVYAPFRGEMDPNACEANRANGGFWSPWLKDE